MFIGQHSKSKGIQIFLQANEAILWKDKSQEPSTETQVFKIFPLDLFLHNLHFHAQPLGVVKNTTNRTYNEKNVNKMIIWRKVNIFYLYVNV